MYLGYTVGSIVYNITLIMRLTNVSWVYCGCDRINYYTNVLGYTMGAIVYIITNMYLGCTVGAIVYIITNMYLGCTVGVIVYIITQVP